MLNGKFALTIALLLMLSSVAFAQIGVERNVVNEVKVGEEVSIELLVSLGGEEPSSLIITEEIPAGWTVTSFGGGQDFEGKIKWLLYGSSLKDGKKLTYSLQAPAGFSGEEFLTGVWRTLDDGGVVSGDMIINEAVSVPVEEPEEEPAPPIQPQQQDYTMYIIGGILLIIVVLALTRSKKK